MLTCPEVENRNKAKREIEGDDCAGKDVRASVSGGGGGGGEWIITADVVNFLPEALPINQGRMLRKERGRW